MTHIPDELKKMLIADVKNALTLNLMPEEIMALARLFEISISQFYKDKSALTPEQIGEMFDENCSRQYTNDGLEEFAYIEKQTFIQIVLLLQYKLNKNE